MTPGRIDTLDKKSKQKRIQTSSSSWYKKDALPISQ